ncbi:MAG: beta-propeller domain-containing protein [Rhodocyclaceae bacterium]|nr:beta-propeller domain-containing protein [Rhodocyclaceae bacterium]
MTYRSLGVLAVMLALAGCGGGSGGDEAAGGGSPEQGPALSRVASEAELKSSLEAGLTTPQGATELALAPVVDSPAGGFTGTYVQQQSVDEFDAVRYDGQHLFVAPRRFMTCCFVLDGLQPAAATAGERAIRILATDPGRASAGEVGRIALAEDVSVQGLYIDAGRLIALTGQAYYGGYGGFWGEVAIWAPERLGVRIYDVGNPAAARETFAATLDGVFVDSRRIGDTVYVLSRHTPNLPTLELPVRDDAQARRNRAALQDVSLQEMLPAIEIDGVRQPLVVATDCYLAGDGGAGYPVITTITAIPIDRPREFRSTCYNAESYGAFVSADAIYLTQFIAASAAAPSGTRIHKFSLDGVAIDYRGSAEIEGQVWQGGQADFRISEHQGRLRVFSSVLGRDRSDSVDHLLYVLEEAGDGRQLRVVGRLPNVRRPQEIGKPDEALYGVRFVGDRAYAVTYLRIDPLYVFDLADPADPRLIGEMTASGFSDFLHPVTDDLLLGLGAADNGGVKVELFDVSDPALPASRGSQVLGGAGSYSEARYDRHAFAYLADVGGVDRFAIPASLAGIDEFAAAPAEGLYLFEIHDKAAPSAARLVSRGVMAAPASAPPAARNRAFIHDDAVFHVRDETVWSASWDDPGELNGPF